MYICGVFAYVTVVICTHAVFFTCAHTNAGTVRRCKCVMYAWVRIHSYAHIWISAMMHLYTYAWVCIYSYARMYECVFKFMRVHSYAWVRMHSHVQICAHMSESYDASVHICITLVCIYTYVSHSYVYMYTCASHSCVNTHMHQTRMYICTHMHGNRMHICTNMYHTRMYTRTHMHHIFIRGYIYMHTYALHPHQDMMCTHMRRVFIRFHLSHMNEDVMHMYTSASHLYYTHMLFTTHICSLLHTYALYYTHMLFTTHICSLLHTYALYYTHMLFTAHICIASSSYTYKCVMSHVWTSHVSRFEMPLGPAGFLTAKQAEISQVLYVRKCITLADIFFDAFLYLTRLVRHDSPGNEWLCLHLCEYEGVTSHMNESCGMSGFVCMLSMSKQSRQI